MAKVNGENHTDFVKKRIIQRFAHWHRKQTIALEDHKKSATEDMTDEAKKEFTDKFMVMATTRTVLEQAIKEVANLKI